MYVCIHPQQTPSQGQYQAPPSQLRPSQDVRGLGRAIEESIDGTNLKNVLRQEEEEEEEEKDEVKMK